MTPTWGDKLPYLGRQRLGVGVRLDPSQVPVPREVHYHGFRNGLMFADRPGDVQEGHFSRALDTESTRTDGVRLAKPISVVELTLHRLDNWMVHTTLDFESELIAVDPPWFGIRRGGTIEWYDVGDSLDATKGAHWVWSNYGDTLIFSNGIKSYYRAADSSLFAAISTMPGAATIFTAFGRLFMGGTLTNTGEYNVLALLWNGTGDYTDWEGANAGGELLLADTGASDRIIAGRILSYDTVAILCRRSLWVGFKTGVADRPIDPQLRLAGIGCVFEQSAQTTEGGITFLSDEGVRHFDGQKAEIISGPINRELLPLSFDDVSVYRAAWDAARRRYILCAPCSTFVYQFPTAEYPQGAWFKKSVAFTNIIPFARQVDDLRWSDLGDEDGTWAEPGPRIVDATWLTLSTAESLEAPEILYASGCLYGVEDIDGNGYFGLVQSGIVEPRPAEDGAADDRTHELMEVKAYLVEYKGEGDLQILSRDETGSYRITVQETLPPALFTKTKRIHVSHSIRGTGIALRLLSPRLEIMSVKQVVQDSGPALADMFNEDDEFFDEAATDVYSEADTLVFWK